MADTFTLLVSDTSARLRLDRISQAVRRNLRTVAELYEQKLLAAIQADTPHRTGALLASLKGSVRDGQHGVLASVHAGDQTAWYAHIVEGGAKIPAHEILPRRADVLALLADNKTIFARRVESPGATIDPRRFVGTPFAALKDEIVGAMEKAVDDATRES